MEAEAEEGWGTWEELILVSAVLRHGTAEWEAVAAELRARTCAPGRFTSEVCKGKYEDLQQQYPTCSDLLEELRKQRITELRRTLEKFDGSIGYLQTKLQTLKAKKDLSSSIDYQSSPLESPAQTSERQSSGKEPSKDGLSAGSFTQGIHKIRSPPLNAPTAPLEAAQIRPQARPPSGSSKQQQKPLVVVVDLVKIIRMELGIGVKKKRGKRKRRGCSQVEVTEEENVNETVLETADRNLPLLTPVKVEPTSEGALGSPQHVRSEYNEGFDASKCNELTRVFDMISSNEYASIFRRRLDSQKRARYRRIVRQHMDLDMIKSRIDNRAITSTKELLRDVLLLATNAAIFYSRNTREHKYAVILKGIVIKLVMEHKKNSSSVQTPPAVAASPAAANAPVISPASAPSVKSTSPDSGHLDNHKSPEKLRSDENISQVSQTAQKLSKPKDSGSFKTSSQARNVSRQTQIAKHRSIQQSQVNLAAFLNERKANDDESMQPSWVKLAAYENELNVADLSRQQPLVKLAASLNEHNAKADGSIQPSQVKLTALNEHNVKAGSKQQAQAKLPATLNEFNFIDLFRQQQPQMKLAASINEHNAKAVSWQQAQVKLPATVNEFNFKDISRQLSQQPQMKLAASVNEHNVKAGSRQQAQAKLAATLNEYDFTDLPRQLQPQMKLAASVNEHNVKAGSRQQAQAKLPATLNECNFKDLFRQQQPQMKLAASVNECNFKDSPRQQQPVLKLASSVNERNFKDLSRQQQPLVKIASSVNEPNLKDLSRKQQPLLKLASSVNERNFKDLSRKQQPLVKSASVNDSKERKRARRK